MGEDVVGMVVRQHEDAGLAEHLLLGQLAQQRPEEMPRLMARAPHDHVRVSLPHGHDAEACELADQPGRLVQVAGLAHARGQFDIRAGELVDQISPLVDIHEGALGQGELDPGRIHVGQLVVDHGLDVLFRRQENKPGEARQVARGLDDPRVVRFGQHHGRPVIHDLDDLSVQRFVERIHLRVLSCRGYRYRYSAVAARTGNIPAGENHNVTANLGWFPAI